MSCIDIFHYDYCFNNCIIYMIMKEERQIGEVFKYNGVKLKVRKKATFEECCDCYFNHKSRYIECSKAICLFSNGVINKMFFLKKLRRNKI